MFENLNDNSIVFLNKEKILFLLRKQCYCFINGENIFKSAVKQIDEEKMSFYINREESWSNFKTFSFINALLVWRNTDEGFSYWRSLNSDLHNLFHKYNYSTLKLPNKTKKKFIEINDG